MADLFSLTELASFLQRDLDTSSATLARTIATGLIEAEVGPISAATSTVTLPIDCEGYVHIPVQVVTDVTGVEVAGEAAEFEWERPFPRVRLTSWTRSAGVAWQTADVTLEHGYATIPAQLKAIALSVAARAYDNPEGLRQQAVDDYSQTRAGSDDDLAGVTLTAAELKSLAKLMPGSYTTSS